MREDSVVTTRAGLTRASILSVLAGLATMLAGCIKVDYEVATEVTPRGACERKLSLAAKSDILRYADVADIKANVEAGNWKFEQRKSGNEVSLALSKDFDSVHEMAEEALGSMPIDIPLVREGDILQPGTASLDVRNLFFVAHYKYSETTPKVKLKARVGPIGVGVRRLTERLMKAKVALTLPGKITKTNGDLENGSTATWEMTLPKYLDGYTMTAESRIVHEWAFAVVGVGIVALILVLITLTRAWRRAPEETEHGGETGYGE